MFSSRMQSFTVFFLLPLIFTVHAELVTNFTGTCDEFFYKGLKPKLDASKDYVHICQRSANKSHFATLYDRANRIPVYSAYIYEYKSGSCPRNRNWSIEPQLVDQNWEKDMMTERELEKKHPNVFMGDKQAIDSDYIGLQEKKGFNRGHLNPNQHHQNPDCKATFTLTNIVPQNKELNGGSWAKYENKLRETFKDCKTVYVVVGAIPSEDHWVIKNNQKRVNIPDYLWHTYCCLDNNDKPYKSGAAAVKNENTKVEECPINSLKELFHKVKQNINPFEDCNAQISIGDGDCTSVVPIKSSANKLWSLLSSVKAALGRLNLFDRYV